MLIPYYSNTKDNTRCVQACLRMLFGFFIPEQKMTWRRLDQLTGHKPGKWTWDIDAIHAIVRTLKDASIISIDSFDHKRFAERGVKHLEDIWTVAVFREQKEHADLRGIQKKTQRLLARKPRRYYFLHRQPRLQDLARLFSQGIWSLRH